MFWTHHKTGTVLLHDIKRVVAGHLRLVYNGHNVHECPEAGALWQYAAFGSLDLEVILAKCPHFRAVHMIRDPLELLASSYMYHSHSNDTMGMATGPSILAGKPLEEGLQIEAQAITAPDPWAVFAEMMPIHKEMGGDPRVLTLHLGEFEADYDGTARRMFHFLFDGTEYESEVEALVMLAKQYDSSDAAPSPHIAGKDEKVKVRAAIDELLRRGDPAVQRVASFRSDLGFDAHGWRAGGAGAGREE